MLNLPVKATAENIAQHDKLVVISYETTGKWQNVI